MSTVDVLDSGYDLNVLHRSGDYFAAEAQNGPYAGDFFVRVASGKSRDLSTVYQSVVDLDTGYTASRVSSGGRYTAWENSADAITNMAPSTLGLKFGPAYVTATTTALMTAGRFYMLRAFTTRPRTLTELGVGVTGNHAPNNYLKLAILGSREDGLPGALLAQTPELTADTGGVYLSGAIPDTVLVPGRLYWLCAHISSNPTLFAVSGSNIANGLGYDVSGGIGANMNRGGLRYALTYSSGVPDYLDQFDGSGNVYATSGNFPIVMGS